MNKSILIVIYTITPIVLLLYGCYGNSLPGKVAPVSSDIDPQTIFVSSGRQHTEKEKLTLEFTSSVIHGTYGGRLEDTFVSFHVPEGEAFIGQIHIEHYRNFVQQYAIICLVNYQQRPCHTDRELVQFIEFPANTTHNLPLKIDGLSKGMHDLEAVIVSIPFAENAYGQPNSFDEAYGMPTMANVYVGESTKKPVITPLVSQPQKTQTGDFGFIANLLPNMREERGVPVWLQERVQAGNEITFYLHFQDEHFGMRRINALTAFLDYRQIPLLIDGREQMPLYLQRVPGTWQSFQAAIEAPTQPGSYVLLFVYRTHAHVQLEGSRLPFLFDEAFTTIQAVEIVVEP